MRKIMAVVLCICLMISLMPVTFAATETAFYVDPQRGSDSNDGSQGAPFATVQKAQSAVRKINQDMNGDIVVYLRGGEYNFTDSFTTREVPLYAKGGENETGTYTVKTALQFTAEDSGSNGHYVIYKAYGNEQPVFHSAKKVSGWELHDAEKNIYKANVGKGISARQFYVDGVRGTRARTEGAPNQLKMDKNFGFTTAASYFAALKNQDRIEMVTQCHWCNHRVPVKKIEKSGNGSKITMQDPAWSMVLDTASPSLRSEDQVLYFENAYEFLDSDGEWYLDETEGTLYYRPRADQDMSSAETILPMVDELVYIKGESLDNPVHHMKFDGIDFEYTTWLRPNTANGYHINQTNYIREEGRLPEAAFTAETTNNMELVNCGFYHTGSIAVKFINGVRNSKINGNIIIDSASNGINVEDFNYCNNDTVKADPRALFENVEIMNNYIQNVCQDYRSGDGIAIGFGQNIKVSHNEILYTPFGGIVAGWHENGDQIVKNVEISNNYIMDIEPDGMYDNGAIYTLGKTAGSNEIPGYHIKENYIKNQMNGQAPLYADNCSSWWLAEENVIDLSDSPIWQKWGSKEPQDPIWFYTQHSEPLGEGNKFINNYTTTDNYENHAKETVIEGNKVYPDANWPAEALAIIENAGLEKAYEANRPVQNVVQNASFEYRQTNIWKANSASFEQVVGESVRWVQAAKVEARKSGASLSQNIALEQGKKYTASAWVKASKAGRIQLKVGNTAVDSKTVEKDKWVQIKGDFKATGKEAVLSVEFPGNGTYYVDEVFTGEYRDTPVVPSPSPTTEPTAGPSTEPTVTPDTKTFEDIQNHWAKEDIEMMTEKGIINGVDETHFMPESDITRAEFMALIVRMLGLEEVSYRNGYWDVPSSSWYANTVQTAVDNGLIDSAMTEGTLIRPEQAINREEMTSLIVKAYEKKTGKTAPDISIDQFDDKGDISDWAAGYVKGAYGLGIIKGMSESEFAPKAQATRAQSAAMIRRLYDID